MNGYGKGDEFAMKKDRLGKKMAKEPGVLEEQIWIRFGLGVVMSVVGIVLLFSAGPYIGLPWFLIAAYLIGSSTLLTINCISGKITTIVGVCRGVETAGLRRRPTAAVIVVDGSPVRIQLHQRRSAIREGDTVVVYVSDRTPVYRKDGCDNLYGFYAMEVRRSRP